MHSHIKDFRVPFESRLHLKQWPTEIAPLYASPKDYEALLKDHTDRLSKMQEILYATGDYALLLIFQGMDASGKDGAIRHVMNGVNPQGCIVTSFKEPSAEESRHDFLWRSATHLPPRGMIGIFNRSYYEEVLVTKVHPDRMPPQERQVLHKKKEKFWRHRYESILALEEHLFRSNTRILKFFLNVSREVQRTRLLARIDEPAKNWKFNAQDIKERGLWKEYRKAYEECIAATSTQYAPWHIVPADDKDNARLILSQIILNAVAELKIRYPEPSADRATELEAFRRRLAKE